MSAFNCGRYILRKGTSLAIFMVLFALAVSDSRCVAQPGMPSGAFLTNRSDDLPSNIDFPTVLGQNVTQAALRGRPVLIAFLQMIPDTAENASRVQLQYLRSMSTQYRSMGLAVLIVDESYLASHVPSKPDDLINAVYDLNLNGLPLMPDFSGEIRSNFHVNKVPTIILFDAAGHVARRWNGLVLPAFLAESIQGIGGSSHKDVGRVNNTR
jgi:hypothetical protein